MNDVDEKEVVRILHVVQRMEAAGLQSFIMNIYRKIDRTKIQFDFLTHYSERQFYDDEIESLGGKIHRLTFREDHNPIKYILDLKIFFKEHPEYKIVHGHMDSLGYFYLGAAKRAGVPCRIAHAHNVLIGGDFKKRIRNIMNRAYKLNATKLLACSDAAGKYMFGNYSFEVIRNPIDVSKFRYDEGVRHEVRDELQLKDEDIVIGHVGRFSPQKNHRFLLDVFKEISKKEANAKLLLVGQGKLEKEIKEDVFRSGIADRVIFVGVRGDIHRIYQAMDAFVLPSSFEGFGIVAIEAQAAGLPTICSDRIPQMANVTERFYSISLSEPAEIWADSILNRLNAPDRESMAQKLIEVGYDVSTVKSEMLNIYFTELSRAGLI